MPNYFICIQFNKIIERAKIPFHGVQQIVAKGHTGSSTSEQGSFLSVSAAKGAYLSNRSNRKTAILWTHVTVDRSTLSLIEMNPVQHIFLITSGNYKGYVICLWCSTLLKANLWFHNCLLYPNIAEWHMNVLSGIKLCSFSRCGIQNWNLKDYVRHVINSHKTVLFFTCPDCGIAFMSRAGVQLHRKSVDYKCAE